MLATVLAAAAALGMMLKVPAVVMVGSKVAGRCWDAGRNRGILDGVECIERIHGKVLKGRVADAVRQMLSKVR